MVCVIAVSISWARSRLISGYSESSTNELSSLQKNSLMAESEKIRKRILELRQTKELEDLEVLADEVEEEWAQKDIVLYAGLMIAINGALASTDFNDNRQYLLLRKYRKLALEKSDQMPIEQEVELLGFTHGDIEYELNLVKEKNWSSDRTERTKLWCHAWQRLEKEIDKNYDVSKRFELNYNLPSEKRRQEQEKDFKQRRLHRIYKEFSKAFERYATDAYSRKPANISELRYFLKSCVQNAQLREDVLTKVENKIAGKY